MKLTSNLYLVASGKMGFDLTHPSDCNVYLLDCGNGELILIDAGTGESVCDILSNISKYGFSLDQLKFVFLTHVHADHCGGAYHVRERTGAQVALTVEAKCILETADEKAINLPKARDAGLYPIDYQFNSCKVDVELRDGDRFIIGNVEITVLLTPGHSQFDTCFLVTNDDKTIYLFSGDTVFYDGKVSLLNSPDVSIPNLAFSVQRLSEIKINTLLPGHYQPALRNGSWHIAKALERFNNLMLPPNII